MKTRFLLTCLSFMIGMIGFSFAQVCDQTFPTVTVNEGDSYTFTDSFTNQSSADVQIDNIQCGNCGTNNYTVPGWTTIVNPGQTIPIINFTAQIATNQSFQITYTVTACEVMNPNNCVTHTECQPVTVVPEPPVCGDGVVEGSEECDGTGQAQCAAGSVCEGCQCVTQNPGVCGSANGTTYYAFADNGTSLNASAATLCPAGQTVTNFAFDAATHTFSWTCSLNNIPSPACTAPESYCGDGVLGQGVGYTNQEQCDDGDSDPFDGCVTTVNGGPVCQNPACGDGYVQSGEACDDGNTVDGDGCESDCQFPTVDAECGGIHQDVIYDANNNGDAITANTPGLCETGTVTNFVYNSQTHTRSWTCDAPTGGQDATCNATELRCGNNTIDPNSGESCDGSGQAQCDAGQTCNACVCVGAPNDGVCGSTNGTSIYDANNSGDALTATTPGLCVQGTVANFTYNPVTHSRSWTCVGTQGGENDQCNATERRCGNGLVDANSGEDCDGSGQAQCNAGQTCQSAICQCVSTPPSGGSGQCGTIDNTWIYDADNNGDAITATTPGLCAEGNVSMFQYNPTTHMWTWQCVTAVGTDMCTVGERRCGNGTIDIGSNEACDDGNTVNDDACTNTCTKKPETPTTTAGSTTSSNTTSSNTTSSSTSAGSTTSSSNSGGGGGGGRPSSIVCGDGKIDGNEQCDEGPLNGKSSTCSASCTIPSKGGGSVNVKPKAGNAKCAFVDPPSIQMGELLPYWWDLEYGGDIRPMNRCSLGTLGMVDADSMICTFTVTAPDGKTYKHDEPCMSTELKKVGWYQDFQTDAKVKIESNRGQSVMDSKDWKMDTYGEYTITLDEIRYKVCEESSKATATSSATYALSVPKISNARVCQFNFAVTTPYFVQKGTALSSFPDDAKKLSEFRRIDGKTVVEVTHFDLLEGKSDTNTFDTMKETVYKEVTKAVQSVSSTSPLGAIDTSFKKIPNQEVYVIQKGFTINIQFEKPFNEGKPTTMIMQGPGEITIKGSLPGNVLIVAPEGTIVLANEDCDRTDTIHATLIAKTFRSSLEFQNPNRSRADIKWCSDGRLVVQGVLVSRDGNALKAMRDARRSTLNDWFNGNSAKADHIYAGAAFRIDARPAKWDALPPLTKHTSVFVKVDGHNAADEPVLSDLMIALFDMIN